MVKYELLTSRKPKTAFASRLGSVLKVLAISQKKLAESGDVSPSTISAYLSGQSQPAADVLSNWVRDFAVNANWLLTGEGETLLGGSSQAPAQAPHDESSSNFSPAQREMLTYKRIQTELGMPKTRIAEGIETIIRGRYAHVKMNRRKGDSGRMNDMLDNARDNQSEHGRET